jgi:hypothetical protein
MCLSFVGCAPTNRNTTTQSFSVSDDYLKLNAKSNYQDIVNLMGDPDRVLDKTDAPIPNFWLFYKKCKCALFMLPGKRTKTGFDISKATYMRGGHK